MYTEQDFALWAVFEAIEPSADGALSGFGPKDDGAEPFDKMVQGLSVAGQLREP